MFRYKIFARRTAHFEYSWRQLCDRHDCRFGWLRNYYTIRRKHPLITSYSHSPRNINGSLLSGCLIIKYQWIKMKTLRIIIAALFMAIASSAVAQQTISISELVNTKWRVENNWITDYDEYTLTEIIRIYLLECTKDC